MKKNIGNPDRIVRLILGLVFIILALYWKCWFCTVFGLILILTAGIGWCGLYQLFKISTCKIKK
jgi:hypothetical protein